MSDPFPNFAGRVLTMPCERCGDPVSVKLAIGEPEDLMTEWANDTVRFLCLPCGLLTLEVNE